MFSYTPLSQVAATSEHLCCSHLHSPSPSPFVLIPALHHHCSSSSGDIEVNGQQVAFTSSRLSCLASVGRKTLVLHVLSPFFFFKRSENFFFNCLNRIDCHLIFPHSEKQPLWNKATKKAKASVMKFTIASGKNKMQTHKLLTCIQVKLLKCLASVSVCVCAWFIHARTHTLSFWHRHLFSLRLLKTLFAI